MNVLNGIIKHPHETVTWTFDKANLVPSTSWTLVDLKQRVATARKWTGSEDQLETTIDNFVMAEFLSLDETTDRYSITPKLLDWLSDHASSLHQAVLNEPPPNSWRKEIKGGWLDFNEIMFKYIYSRMGDSWRDLRNAINKEIGTHTTKAKAKKLDRDYTNDYIGERPGYWIVIYIVGLLGPISQWSIPGVAGTFKISNYANDPTDVVNAAEELREYGIITKDEAGHVQIAPQFASRMKDVISAVELNIPKLRAECLAWKKGAAAKNI
jgi:hypothetical protein